MTAVTRPVLRYHGGKWRIAPWVIAHFPPHRVYVEPFGGAASVLMRKPRSYFEVYNDLDQDVVNLFAVMRDKERAPELQRLLYFTPWARLEFERCYEPSDDPIEMARRTVVRCFMAHGSTSRRRGRSGFRAASHPHRKGGGFGDFPGYTDAIATFTERLRGVIIECRPALDIITRHDALDALFYVDPPYPMSTRTSIRGKCDTERAYAHELTDDDHRELAAVLAQCKGAVVISGYSCELYNHELYAGWERDTKKARADGGKDRTEVLWTKPAGVRMPAPRALIQSTLALGDA